MNRMASEAASGGTTGPNQIVNLVRALFVVPQHVEHSQALVLTLRTTADAVILEYVGMHFGNPVYPVGPVPGWAHTQERTLLISQSQGLNGQTQARDYDECDKFKEGLG